MDDSTQLDLTVNPPQIKLLNRTAYLWTIETMMHLQEVMNWVVDLCNQYGIVDVETGENTGYLTLWLPRRLAIDNIYQQKLKDDFDLCNKLLDKLTEQMKIFQ